jgi:hypothetical protein
LTHAQSLTPNHAGLPPSACGGELCVFRQFPDREWLAGGWREREVTVYRCVRCGWIVSMEAERALNAYPWGEPTDGRHT